MGSLRARYYCHKWSFLLIGSKKEQRGLNEPAVRPIQPAQEVVVPQPVYTPDDDPTRGTTVVVPRVGSPIPGTPQPVYTPDDGVSGIGDRGSHPRHHYRGAAGGIVIRRINRLRDHHFLSRLNRSHRRFI